MATQHDKQFKLDAIQYYQDHKDLGVRGCAENLGIGYSTLTKWLKDFRESVIFFCLAIMVKININIPLYQTASREKVRWEGWKPVFVKQRIHIA